MITIKCIPALRENRGAGSTGILLMGVAMTMGLVIGFPVPVESKAPGSTPTDIPSEQTTLTNPSQPLDHQPAEVESRIHSTKETHGPQVTDADSLVVNQDPKLVATRIEPEQESESEVQQLEETVVEDTYLDPFTDETNAQVIRDPWEPMNAKVFSFNLNVDRYVLKPVATGYAWIVPDPVERAIGRAIMNIRFVPRTINDVLQWKWENAGVEVSRFLINSTVGLAGLFDVAGDYLDLKAVPEEDFGQTLAKHGVQPGPYLVLPLLPPTTVRDGIGTVGDLFLDPLNYFLPFVPQASMRATEIVNERSQNLELYEGVEIATLDMYSAVREAYSQKRSKAIRE